MLLVMGKEKIEVKDFAEASAIWRQYIESNDLGASQVTISPTVQVDGNVYPMSYNGKIWKAKWTVDGPNDLIYNPYKGN